MVRVGIWYSSADTSILASSTNNKYLKVALNVATFGMVNAVFEPVLVHPIKWHGSYIGKDVERGFRINFVSFGTYYKCRTTALSHFVQGRIFNLIW